MRREIVTEKEVRINDKIILEEGDIVHIEESVSNYPDPETVRVGDKIKANLDGIEFTGRVVEKDTTSMDDNPDEPLIHSFLIEVDGGITEELSVHTQGGDTKNVWINETEVSKILPAGGSRDDIDFLGGDAVEITTPEDERKQQVKEYFEHYGYNRVYDVDIKGSVFFNSNNEDIELLFHDTWIDIGFIFGVDCKDVTNIYRVDTMMILTLSDGTELEIRAE